jgi:L-lysine 2,3-aminomutase
MGDPSQAVMIVATVAVAAVSLTSIAKVWRKRIETRPTTTMPDAIEERLARIENAVDVIAVEVERISEAQRFSARLDAERETRRVANPATPGREGRVVTPH